MLDKCAIYGYSRKFMRQFYFHLSERQQFVQFIGELSNRTESITRVLFWTTLLHRGHGIRLNTRTTTTLDICAADSTTSILTRLIPMEISFKLSAVTGYWGFTQITSSSWINMCKQNMTRLLDTTHFAAGKKISSVSNKEDILQQLHSATCRLVQHVVRQATEACSQNNYERWIQSSSCALMKQIHRLSLPERVRQRKPQLVFHPMTGLAPQYVCALFQPVSSVSTRNTQSNAT